MARTIGGTFAGILVFMATLMALEFLGHRLFPAPKGGELPLGLQLFVILAYFLGALAGGFAAVRISKKPWTAWLIAILILVAAAYTIATMPHPLLMKVGGLLAPLLGGLFAHHFGRAPMTAPGHART
jgi:peptidoglycan/LPS O-acetylase OafA/YrhL